MSSSGVFSFLLLAVVGGVLMLALISSDPKRRKRQRPHATARRAGIESMSREQIFTRWTTIQAMAAGGGNGLRQAITEADKLFDHVLRQQGCAGDTMGDRLKSARSRFTDRDVYDHIWRAHKVRNALAHEVGFDLVPSQAKEALADFEAGLRTLGAL